MISADFLCEPIEKDEVARMQSLSQWDFDFQKWPVRTLSGFERQDYSAPTSKISCPLLFAVGRETYSPLKLKETDRSVAIFQHDARPDKKWRVVGKIPVNKINKNNYDAVRDYFANWFKREAEREAGGWEEYKYFDVGYDELRGEVLVRALKVLKPEFN